MSKCNFFWNFVYDEKYVVWWFGKYTMVFLKILSTATTNMPLLISTFFHKHKEAITTTNVNTSVYLLTASVTATFLNDLFRRTLLHQDVLFPIILCRINCYIVVICGIFV